MHCKSRFQQYFMPFCEGCQNLLSKTDNEATMKKIKRSYLPKKKKKKKLQPA